MSTVEDVYRSSLYQVDPLVQAMERSEQPSVNIVNAAELVPKPVTWLWHGWLASGKLHILAGSPGQGKTTIAMALAATVSGGGRWPDGTECEPGNVLIWSGEDDPADTLLPRLVAAGADPARCYFVQGTTRDYKTLAFDPSRDLEALREKVEEIGGVSLLVVDPVVSAVAGDSHKNSEVRRALQPLVDMAACLGVAVLGISHFGKGTAGADPATRVIGSIAFTAVARVVLVAAKVLGGDGVEHRILARGKSNIGSDQGGFEYQISEAEPIPGIPASRIVWGQPVTGSARELLAEPEATDASNPGALGEAVEFLRELLSGGDLPNREVVGAAEGAGIAERTLRRASKVLKVRKRRRGEAWHWSLPGGPEQAAQAGQVLHFGQYGQLDQDADTTI